MSSSLFTLTFLLLISLFQINATPVLGPESEGRHLGQFANMIQYTLGVFPLDYNGYGCWCGYGGKGEPVDATDGCCKVHDQCYGNIMDTRAHFYSCSPYAAFYNWDFDTKTFLPVCQDKPGSCAYNVCECDRAVTACYKQNFDTFNKTLKCSN